MVLHGFSKSTHAADTSSPLKSGVGNNAGISLSDKSRRCSRRIPFGWLSGKLQRWTSKWMWA